MRTRKPRQRGSTSEWQTKGLEMGMRYDVLTHMKKKGKCRKTVVVYAISINKHLGPSHSQPSPSATNNASIVS
jgi:hypothetical protein